MNTLGSGVPVTRREHEHRAAGTSAWTAGDSSQSTTARAAARCLVPRRTPAYSTCRKQPSVITGRVGRGRLGVRGVDDLGRRAGGVGHHERPVALADAPENVAVVGLGPAVGDLDAVGCAGPPSTAASRRLAVPRDRREQERQARRGRRRVLRRRAGPCRAGFVRSANVVGTRQVVGGEPGVVGVRRRRRRSRRRHGPSPVWSLELGAELARRSVET